MMSLMISGPKQPGNDIDVFLAPLIEELKSLWEKGVRVWDAYRKEFFTIFVILLCTINDLQSLLDLFAVYTGVRITRSFCRIYRSKNYSILF
jgi:Transposase family tnp2